MKKISLLSRIFPFGNNSDHDWELFGQENPYYGVLSGPEFRSENLDAKTKESFFTLGESHVKRVVAIIKQHFQIDISTSANCLDFGCGVGRLVIPFAKRFRHVTGIDISDSMIAEAKVNCLQNGVENVKFGNSLSSETAEYDLVHTYIVLQHIPLSRGMEILDRLISIVKPGGFCALHFTIGRDAGSLRQGATWLRKNIKPVHWVLNASARVPVFEPYMQSNPYSLKDIMIKLAKVGVTKMWLEVENHGGPYSTMIVFRKPVLGSQAGSRDDPETPSGA